MNTFSVHTHHKSNLAGQMEATLLLEGSLDNSTVAILQSHLDGTLEAKPAVLVFDLAGLRFVTSTGIRTFVLAAKRQKAHQGQTSFINLQPQIKEVFAIMGSLPDMRVFKDQSELDAYLLTRQRSHGP